MPAPLASLTCPQCGGPLPRQARWRTLACPFCQAAVGRGGARVERERFRAAWRLAAPADSGLLLGGRRWRLLADWRNADGKPLALLERLGPWPERALLLPAAAGEAERLRTLQQLQTPGSDFFARLLPQLIADGLLPQPIADGLLAGERVQLLRLPPGLWGSLADALAAHPNGFRDPRHLVWIGRRVLEQLRWLHGAGHHHGALHAGHWLLQPRDHGVCLLGWATAGRDDAAARRRDLLQTGWTLRQCQAALADRPPPLRADLPAPLAALLRRWTEDATWLAGQDAESLHRGLGDAAREAFGPPQFVAFNPLNA